MTVRGHHTMLERHQIISHANSHSTPTKYSPPWIHTCTHASHSCQHLPNAVSLVFAGAPLHPNPVQCAGRTRDLWPVLEVPDVRQHRHQRDRRLRLEPCEHRAVVRNGSVQPPLIPGGPRIWASARTLFHILRQCQEVQAGVRSCCFQPPGLV